MAQIEEIKENKFAVMPVGRLLLTMAFPMIVSQLVKALYNTVDSYFVSALSMQAMTAITLAYSAQAILNAFAVGLGIGINSAMARQLGRGNPQGALTVLKKGLLSAAVIVLVFVLFGVFGCTGYYRGMGADSETTRLGVQYLRVCMIACFGLVFSAVMESMLQATGHAVCSMLVQGSCFLLNMILDPILISGYFGFPELGICGAAYATVFSQFFGLLLGIVLNLRYNRAILPDELRGTEGHGELRAILAVGFPSMMLNMLVPVMTLGMNALLMPYSSEYVALFGIYFRVQLFFFLPLFGINNGLIPIVSFNKGAKCTGRVKEAAFYALAMALCISVVGLLAFQLFGKQILLFFHATDSMLTLGVRAFRIISLTFPLAAVSICMSGLFQGLGDGVFGLVINIVRQLFVVAVALYLVKRFGLQQVWFAYWCSELLAAFVCAFYSKKKLRERLLERAE